VGTDNVIFHFHTIWRSDPSTNFANKKVCQLRIDKICTGTDGLADRIDLKLFRLPKSRQRMALAKH
jgi:hypothetical protein